MKKRMGILCALLLLFLYACGEKKAELETVDVNYLQETAMLSFHEGNLNGRLMHPTKDNHETLVIIIPGSGRIDLNGNNELTGSTNNLLMISEFLADEGYHSLRYDKRGVGESSELISTESDIDFHDSVDDVVKWVEKYKKDLRFKHIVLLGHGEGALMAAQVSIMQDHIDGLITLEATAVTGDKQILELLKLQSEELYESSIPIIEELKVGNLVTRVPYSLFNYFRPSVQPYLISWFSYDPMMIAQQIKVPTLILHGNRDLKINESQGKLLHQAVAHSKLVIIPGMNHVLKPANSNMEENLATYNNPKLPLHVGVEKEVISFLKEIINEG